MLEGGMDALAANEAPTPAVALTAPPPKGAPTMPIVSGAAPPPLVDPPTIPLMLRLAGSCRGAAKVFPLVCVMACCTGEAAEEAEGERVGEGARLLLKELCGCCCCDNTPPAPRMLAGPTCAAAAGGGCIAGGGGAWCSPPRGRVTIKSKFAVVAAALSLRARPPPFAAESDCS